MKLGLRSKILVIAFLVVTGTVMAIAVSSSYFLTRQSTQAYQSRSLAIAKGLAIQLERILALGIDPADLTGFEEQCSEAVARYRGLSYAMVLGNDGRMLFHSDRDRMGRKVESRILAAARDQQQSISVDDSERIHAVIEPVKTLNGEEVAYVVVGFPQGIIDHERNQLLLLTVGVGATALVVGLTLLFAALSYTVVRPISSFVDHIKGIREGEGYGSRRLESDKDDELGIMVNGFNELLDRIAERERDLVGAKEAAEAANTAKTQFLAVMSHELRTPLSAVLGMNELLLGTSLDAKQQRFATTVKTSGKALLRLINDILDFSQIESGKLSIRNEAFDFRQRLEQTIQPFRHSAHSKGLNLTLSIDPTLPAQVIGDPTRVGQILDNLLNNAVKFTERGDIRVSATPSQEGIRLAVSDSGIGIPADFIEHIYDSFRQADGSQTRRYGGTGLGLAIVKQLVDNLNGRIHVSSQEGQGSTFWVDLPLAAAASRNPSQTPTGSSDPEHTETPPEKQEDPEQRACAPRSPEHPTPEKRDQEPSNEKKQILLVEDNRVHQEFVTHYLSALPYSLTLAATGTLALERIAERRFDAILMDWQLPDLDGLQTSKAIREREQRLGAARTPIIALTAHAFHTDQAACLDAGMDDYLSKPFTRESLLSKLERWT